MANIVYARPDDHRAALYVDGVLFDEHNIDADLFGRLLESLGHEFTDKYIEDDEIGLWLEDRRDYRENQPYEVTQ